MKILFVVFNEVFTERVMGLLNENKIDYYTKWDHVAGKGHGTEPHLGTRSFPGMNAVLMIAFQDESSLKCLVSGIVRLNKEIMRADDHVRVFQVPLESIV